MELNGQNDAVTSHRTALQDMEERWLPTPESIDQAVALLNATPAADLALIPMIQPGKDRSVWSLSQEVYTVPGVIVLAANRDEAPPFSPVSTYSQARGYVGIVARRALEEVLRGREPEDGKGTTAYAVVERTGHAAVFEDF